jgi:hypothetical protein
MAWGRTLLPPLAYNTTARASMAIFTIANQAFMSPLLFPPLEFKSLFSISLRPETLVIPRIMAPTAAVSSANVDESNRLAHDVAHVLDECHIILTVHPHKLWQLMVLHSSSSSEVCFLAAFYITITTLFDIAHRSVSSNHIGLSGWWRGWGRAPGGRHNRWARRGCITTKNSSTKWGMRHRCVTYPLELLATQKKQNTP